MRNIGIGGLFPYLSERAIVCFGEADILAIGDDVSLRELLPHHIHTAVHRVVVDHPYVQLQLRSISQSSFRAIDRCQALPQEVLDIVVNYDYI